MRKAVFIVQGEGRGHMSQAMVLMEYCNEAGIRVERVFAGGGRPLPEYFRETFGENLRNFRSPFFIKTPNRKGYDIPRTLLFNLFRIPLYLREKRRIRREIQEIRPDLVINFYDVVGALAMRGLPGEIMRIGVGHHFLLHLEGYPCLKKDPIQKMLLAWHTREVMASCDRVMALSFRDRPGSGKMEVLPPLVGKAVREAKREAGESALIYLLNEGFISDIIRVARENPGFRADVFSALPTESRVPPGITLHAFDRVLFLEKMRCCSRLVTTAGFDTVAEAACMGIPIVAIPSEHHFEQQCNAVDVERSGLGRRMSRMDEEALLGKASRTDPAFEKWMAAAGEIFIKFMTG